MSCPHIFCAQNSSNQMCRSNRKPEECAYGKEEKRVQDAYMQGFRDGMKKAKEKMNQVVEEEVGNG